MDGCRGGVSSPSSQMGAYARRAGGGRRSRTDVGRGAPSSRWRAAPPALRATSPPLHGREEESAAPSHVKDPARRARAVPRAGRGGARAAGEVSRSAGRGPGDRWVCGSFGSRRLNAPRSRLDGGPRRRAWSARLEASAPGAAGAPGLRAGLPRRAPGGRGRIRRARGPLRFSTSRRQSPARPDHRGRLGRGSKTPSPCRGAETHCRRGGAGGDKSAAQPGSSSTAQAFRDARLSRSHPQSWLHAVRPDVGRTMSRRCEGRLGGGRQLPSPLDPAYLRSSC